MPTLRLAGRIGGIAKVLIGIVDTGAYDLEGLFPLSETEKVLVGCEMVGV